MFYPAFVGLSVCLFVCLLATSRENFWSDLHENFTSHVSVDKEVPINTSLVSQPYVCGQGSPN